LGNRQLWAIPFKNLGRFVGGGIFRTHTPTSTSLNVIGGLTSDKKRQSSSSELEMQTTSEEKALGLTKLADVGLFDEVVRFVVLFASSGVKEVFGEFSTSDKIRQSSSSELAIQITSGILSFLDERGLFNVFLGEYSTEMRFFPLGNSA
jgi:hypothetical protein